MAPERREAVVHQRHEGGIDGGDGAHPVQGREREGEAADHRVHRGDGLAGRRGRAPLPLHGTQGDLQRRDPLHERPRPSGERPVGRGEGSEARAHDAEHRPAHPPHLVGRSREALSRDLAAMGERARAVGPGDREARRDRAEDRRHGREHVRDGGSGGAVRRDGGSRQLRHPARGGDREAVQLRGRVAHHRRNGADPRRPRLRNRGLAARAR